MEQEKTLIYMCPVLYVTDNSDGLRIKVRIPYYDDNTVSINDLPYAFPLLPKFMHVNPKVNEMVLVILQNTGATNGNRFFIGPVISQPQKMNFDAYDYSAQSLLNGNIISAPLTAPSLDPDNRGTLPDREDIAIEGRGNSDIILKDSELRIRCGHKVNSYAFTDNCLKFNKEDPSYVQMKYSKMKDAKNNDFSSVVNVVGDRINLLSHDSKTHFELADPEKLITDEEMANLFQKAHQLPYGDELIAFLKDFIRIFLNHTHPFAMDKPKLKQPDLERLTTKSHLDEMLSDSIRIN